MAGHSRLKTASLSLAYVPAIHVLATAGKAWMPGSSPGMTAKAVLSYGAIDTGEKSTNQLFGCTKPLTFGLMARGETSWAT